MNTKDKKELLRKHLGKRVFSYHGGGGEIINTSTEIIITEDTINKIARRNQCFLYESEEMLGYEGKQ